MRKLLFILLITFASCSPEDNGCNCDMNVYMPDGGSFVLTGAPSDCNGNVTDIPDYIIEGNYFPTMKCK